MRGEDLQQEDDTKRLRAIVQRIRDWRDHERKQATAQRAPEGACTWCDHNVHKFVSSELTDILENPYG